MKNVYQCCHVPREQTTEHKLIRRANSNRAIGSSKRNCARQ